MAALAAGSRAAKGGTGGRSGTPFRRAADPPGPGPDAGQPFTAPPSAKPPPRRRAIRTYRRITGVE
ncbi:hypothetical protein CP976_29860 [Streptomyces coeruleorubidus]|uniref:Uncharacterized protein n=1 Tax=Streptomyces coeruleorubidus TaxID=116188 RepID=A0A5J6I640_STRC4|nr:hypothetical protein CP976_29860 [Streptomyces coeruleorubidus]